VRIFAVALDRSPAAGRDHGEQGSFIRSFPLFGYDLDDYDALFAEARSLQTCGRAGITWQGRLRPSLKDIGVYRGPFKSAPRLDRGGPLPIGGARRLAQASMALAIIGGDPFAFRAVLDLPRAAQRAGKDTFRR
jgi:hypothetical protein